MHSTHIGDVYSILEAATLLSFGVVVLVLAGQMAARTTTAATAQRAVWRAVVAGILIMCLSEMTGASAALALLIKSSTQSLVGLSLTASPSSPARPDSNVPLARRTTKSQIAQARSFRHVPYVAAPESAPRVQPKPDDVAPREGSLGKSASRREDSREHLAIETTFLVAPYPVEVRSAPPSAGRVQSDWALVVDAVCVIWPAGALLLFVQSVGRHLRLAALRRRLIPEPNEQLAQRVSDLAACMGLRRPVSILRDDQLAAPMAFGTWKPTIVAPLDLEEQFDAAQQDAIFAHEIAHLAGYDSAWQLLSGAACVLLWWHPFVWYTRRRLRLTTELAADEATLIVPDGPSRLAECLVQLGRQLTSGRDYGWLGMAGGAFRSGLGVRVERLLKLSLCPPQAARSPRWGRARLGLLLALCFTSTVSNGWVRPSEHRNQKGTTMNLLQDSWRRSAAAALTAAFLGPFTTVTDASGAAERDENEKATKVEHVAIDDDSAISDVDEVDEARQDDATDEAEFDVQEKDAIRREIRRIWRQSEDKRIADSDEDEQEAVQRHKARQMERLASQHQNAWKQFQNAGRQGLDAMERQMQELQKLLETLDDDEVPRARALRHQMELMRKEMESKRRSLLHQMESLDDPRPADEGSPAVQRQHRLDHLRIAIENLHEAGLHELAASLEREASRMESDDVFPGDTSTPPRPPMPSAPPIPPYAPEGVYPSPVPAFPNANLPNVDEEVTRLRDELQAVRNDLQEMREMMQEMREQFPTPSSRETPVR